MVSPLLSLDPLARVAILGGGDGGVLGALLEGTRLARSVQPQVDLVDIDDRVLNLAKNHFVEFSRGGFSDPQVNVICGDAFEYIGRQRELDGVVYDLTMDPIRSGQSRSEFIAEIMANIALSLRVGGRLNMQCCGSDGLDLQESPNGLLLSEIINVAKLHFVEIRTQRVLVPSYEQMWIFLSAIKQPIV